MTEAQMILHLRNVIRIACLLLDEGKTKDAQEFLLETKEVQELLSGALKETNVPVWKERVIYPHVE